MQDIDFDEIDRAVNSITNNNSSADTGAQASSAPSPASPPEPTPAPTPLSPAPSPAARRSTGRFMDVVHPSSDMRPPTLDRAPSPVAPRPDLQSEEVVSSDTAADSSKPATAQDQSSAFHWPDPIDMAAPTVAVQESTDTTEPSLVTTDEPSTTPEPYVEENEPDAAPLESPFLMDTKVEKRPLGAFSGADAELPLLEDPIPVSTGASSMPTAEEPTHEEHDEVPHELHGELLALDGHSLDEKEAEPASETVEPAEIVTPESTAMAAVEDIPVGPTSIMQQYKEQPNSDTQTSGSIFDTEAYHQALTHPPKKRSGILIVVWIVALILVGGGIGAAIYFVVLPMLG